LSRLRITVVDNFWLGEVKAIIVLVAVISVTKKIKFKIKKLDLEPVAPAYSPQISVNRTFGIFPICSRFVYPFNLDFHLLTVQLELFVQLFDEIQIVGGQFGEMVQDSFGRFGWFGR
jgi:hypothetical protein